MNTPQLVAGAVLLTVAATACSRDRTEQEARDAAAEVRGVAERAGDRVADGWLTTKIQAQYFADDDIKARYVNVSTRDATVTLTGYVEDDRTRQQAVQIARNTDGVRQVDDRLLIGRAPESAAGQAATPPGTAASSPDGIDGAIATTGDPASAIDPSTAAAAVDDSGVVSLIQARYFLDPAVKMRDIDVRVRDGVVTLSGPVASEAERQQALLLARTTDGVERVEDSLTVDAGLGAGTAPAIQHQPAVPGAPSSAPPSSAPPSSAAPTVAPGGAPPAAAGEARRTDLAAAIEAKLGSDPLLASASVDVTADRGVVTLQGAVPTPAARQRALTLAREATGATQVIDRLRVGK